MLKKNTLIICHRGNQDGPDPYYENSPKAIDSAIDAGFDVEIDIRLINGTFWLGHDRSDYKVDFSWLEARQDRIWAHCKNFEALNYLLLESYINCFYHNMDSYTLTKSGHIWVYPDRDNKLSGWSIAVMPETVKNWQDLNKAFGVCTDKAILYKNLCIE